MTVLISLEMPGSADYIPLARHFGKELMEELKIVPSDIFDIGCVVTELVTNSVRHAKMINGRLQMQIDCLFDRVVITVTDSGKGFYIADIAEPGSIRPDFDFKARVGGFGLPLVAALSSKVDFTCLRPSGMQVRAEVMLCEFRPILTLAA